LLCNQARDRHCDRRECAGVILLDFFVGKPFLWGQKKGFSPLKKGDVLGWDIWMFRRRCVGSRRVWMFRRYGARRYLGVM
ncbi:MAG: hypothetical protein II767_01980, partial [Proteobacteria bacterium]|nr:hypothetical protein [Pseudomonadota bacterium]